MIIILSIVNVLATLFLMPYMIDMIKPRQVALNYLNHDVPMGLGVIFVITIVPTVLIALIFSELQLISGLIFIILILTFGLLGLIDDTIGSRQARGFHGHFRALFRGQLTTGALKAIFGGIIAFLSASMLTDNIAETVINTMCIVLAANFLNLLDVRPGRAAKFFLVCSLGFTIMGLSSPLLWLMAASVIGYLPWDLRAAAMMGDIGSNVLGTVIGLAIVAFPFELKFCALYILVVLNLYSENLSLSQLIANNRLLSFLDCLGRSKI